jgi:hypothetical protein
MKTHAKIQNRFRHNYAIQIPLFDIEKPPAKTYSEKQQMFETREANKCIKQTKEGVRNYNVKPKQYKKIVAFTKNRIWGGGRRFQLLLDLHRVLYHDLLHEHAGCQRDGHRDTDDVFQGAGRHHGRFHGAHH